MDATPQSRPSQVADAFQAVGHVNHYLVMVSAEITLEELEAAEQILITRQNRLAPDTDDWEDLERALDLIADRIEVVTRAK